MSQHFLLGIIFFALHLSQVTQSEQCPQTKHASTKVVTVHCFQLSTYLFETVFNLKSKQALEEENRKKVQNALI